MKESIKKALRSKKYVVTEGLTRLAVDKKLSLNEFLVLMYLDNNYSDNFEIELISKSLGMEVNDTLEAFNSLMLKGLVSLDSVKDLDSRFNEVVNLDKVYECVTNSIESDVKEKNKEDIFKVFERELGRTISSMELEMINGWLATGTSEEIILGALKEAVYNGVSNFRYIDKIIYEWGKKGFKTMDDVNQYMKNRRESKSKDSKVDKKEQEILDYDWLDD